MCACVSVCVFFGWLVGFRFVFFLPGGVASIRSAGQGLEPTFAVKF